MNRDKLFIRAYTGVLLVAMVVVIAIVINAWNNVVVRTVCVGSGLILLVAGSLMLLYARHINSNH